MRRVTRTVLVCALICPFSGCFQEIDVPACRTLADCPAGPGYASCESGWCFVSGRCDHAAPVPGDGCCPRVEGDRTADLDCLLGDLPTGLSAMATPAAGADGRIYVAGVALDGTGTSQVRVVRLGPDGVLTPPRVVGPGKAALAPLPAGDDVVYVAFREGVARVRTADLSIEGVLASGVPTGGLAAVDGADGSRTLAWATAEGDVVLAPEGAETTTVLAGVGDAGTGSTGLVPMADPAGDRLVLGWREGPVVAVDPATLRQVAAWDPPSPIVAGPIVVDGVVVLAGEDRVLRGLVEEGAGFSAAWTLDLVEVPVGGLAVDSRGRVVATARDGRVTVVDAGTGEAVGHGDFGTALAGLPVVRCPSGRLVAVAAGGDGVRSLVPVGDAGATFSTGLGFDVPSAIATGFRVAGDRLVAGTVADRLAVWWFPEGPTAGDATVTGGLAAGGRGFERAGDATRR